MEPKQTLDVKSRLLLGTLCKQSYVWINSIFQAQNICFGSEIAGILDHSYNKCALKNQKELNLALFFFDFVFDCNQYLVVLLK